MPVWIKEILTLRGLVDIIEEAQEDMLDQEVLAAEPEDQKTFSLPQVERHFARHAELQAYGNAGSA